MANENNTQNDPNTFDLDAALEEKFQEVQQDLKRMRAIDAATESKIVPSAPQPIAEPADAPVPQVPEALENTASETPPETAPLESESAPMPEAPSVSPIEESKPDLQTPPDGGDLAKDTAAADTAKERKQRYKKRRSMLIAKNVGSVLRVFSMGILVFSGSIFLLVGTRPTESAEENRKLASFPEFSWKALADGSYTQDVMNYFDDTVPGRSFFKHMISDMQVYKGLSSSGENDVTFIGDISKANSKQEESKAENAVQTTAPAENAQSDSKASVTTAVTEPEPEPVQIGDGIVLVGDRAVSVYGGSYKRGEAYAQSLNAYKKDLGDDVNVYSLVAPTAVSFYLPEQYASYTASEIDNINHINENLDGVIPIDAYQTLEEHKSEDIYARTDHHWLPLGAYYAAQAFAERANLPFPELSSYTATTKQGYVGSMYTFSKSAVLENNPEDFTYYAPKNHYTTTYYDTDFTNPREGNLLIDLDNVEPVSWYLVFMGGDEKITHVSTDVKNGRTLVIVKDSYGNALVPCLTNSFSDIYVTDMRYLDVNAVSFMKEVGATDVLFAMNTFSATGTNSEYLEENRTK